MNESADSSGGLPDEDDDTMYGIICWPSNSAAEALPNAVSDIDPDIHNILSDSIMLLAECVFCNGTIVNWETSVEPWKADPVVRE